jgi:CBS domain containing-hemolysin-like protein
MVLVYEEIPSIIVGMIYVFDLLFEEDEKKGLKNYLRAPIFLPRSTSNEKAFLTLQEKRQSFALVTDMKREVIGAVPIERLLVL